MFNKLNDEDLKWLKDEYPLTDEEKDIIRDWLIKCGYGNNDDDISIDDIFEYKPEQATEFLEGAKNGEIWGPSIIDMVLNDYD